MTQQRMRCAGNGALTPQRDDFVRVGAHRNAERAREAEIGQLQLAIAVNQQILCRRAQADCEQVTVSQGEPPAASDRDAARGARGRRRFP